MGEDASAGLFFRRLIYRRRPLPCPGPATLSNRDLLPTPRSSVLSRNDHCLRPRTDPLGGPSQAD